MEVFCCQFAVCCQILIFEIWIKIFRMPQKMAPTSNAQGLKRVYIINACYIMHGEERGTYEGRRPIIDRSQSSMCGFIALAWKQVYIFWLQGLRMRGITSSGQHNGACIYDSNSLVESDTSETFTCFSRFMKSIFTHLESKMVQGMHFSQILPRRGLYIPHHPTGLTSFANPIKELKESL